MTVPVVADWNAGRNGTSDRRVRRRVDARSVRDKTDAVPLTTPLLATDRLRLRPVSDDDHEELFALHSDPLVMRYWDSPRWRTLDQAHAFVAALTIARFTTRLTPCR